mmetsp:Transcript_28222/g.67037  ORF Transcript_28222/g.67037 Transcript_28222/m.67037 type:complete len:296 (-) Transcript_28222:125-1012(-)
MAPAVSVRFQSREREGFFPAEPIAVPRGLLNLECSELIVKLFNEFWPAVSDDVEDLPSEKPETVEAVTFTINGKRAPKVGTLADIVQSDEELELCVIVKGADKFDFWIPQSQLKDSGTARYSSRKRKASAGDESAERVTPRRKIQRWSDVETNLLIELVKQYGKGKWKKVLEKGTGTFSPHRNSVDLKDKWRNLQRSGAVQLLLEAPEWSDDRAGQPAVPLIAATAHDTTPPELSAVHVSAAGLSNPATPSGEQQQQQQQPAPQVLSSEHVPGEHTPLSAVVPAGVEAQGGSLAG